MTGSTLRFLNRLVAIFTAQCLIGSNLVIAASQIVIDGRTQTQLHIQGAVTDVTTQTVQGRNAYNSFSRFDVHSGNTVNLHVPDAAQNLVNLVHDKGTRIDGVLNAYQQGRIGGNVYFANPHGMVVGAGGIVNVGALSVTTPTRQFMDGFFDAAGNPTASATQHLLDGTAPVNPDAEIDIRGQVNTRGDARLQAGNVTIAGAINSLPATSAGHVLSAPLNTEGLDEATRMVERNGEIWILAEQDARITGAIVTEGADKFGGGGITVRAGKDVVLENDARLSASGRGSQSDGGRIAVMAQRDATFADQAQIDVSGGMVSGDGGFAEFSAKKTVTLSGGQMAAGTSNGKQGDILVDPEILNITTPQLSGGGNKTFQADRRINVASNTLISSRNIGVAGDHQTAASLGDSGSIIFEAPEINIATGAQIFAHAINEGGTNFSAGDILFKADGEVLGVVSDASGTLVNVLESIIDVDAPPTLSSLFGTLFDSPQAKIDIDGATIRGNNITLTASAADRLGFDKQSTASILLNDADLSGQDVTMTAIADTSLLPAQDDPSGSIDIEDATDLVLGLGATPYVSLSSSQAKVLISGDSVINATGDVSIAAVATSKAKQIAPGLLFSVGYGVSNAEAYATLTDTAVIEADGAVVLDATTNSIVDISANSQSVNKPVDITYVEANTEATTFAGTGDATRIDAGRVGVNATTNLDVAAQGSAQQVGASSAGLAIVRNDLSSQTDAVLGGQVNSGGTVDVIALAEMEQNVTRADAASLGSTGSFSTKLGNKIAGVQRNMADSVLAQFTGKSSSIASFLFPGIKSGKLNISGALAFADTLNKAYARIASGADVQASGRVKVQAQIKDDFNLGAVSQTSSDGAAFGGAVAIGNYSNDAQAWIGSGALVDTSAAIEVNAATTLEYPWQVDWSNLEDVLNHLTGNLEDLLFTSYAFNNSKGKTGSLSASVDVINLDVDSLAWIGEGAQINQRLGGGDVGIDANHDINFVQAVGSSVPFSFIKRLLGKAPSKAGLGGSAGFVTIDGDAKAWIDDSVMLTADNLDIKAESKQRLIQLAKAGGTTSDIGVAGTLTHSNLVGTVSAGIESSAVVDVEGSMDIDANTIASDLMIAGAVIKGGNAGVGASISFSNTDTTTKAWIADDDADGLRGGFVRVGNAADVSADNDSDISTYSVAAAVASGVNTATDTSGAKDKGKGKFGLGIAGDVSFNNIVANVFADIAGGADIDVASLNVNARRGGDIFAFSGTVAYAASVNGSSAGLALAYSQNIISGTTRASISHSLVDASGALNVDADTVGSIWSIAAGGSAAPKPRGFAIAGQVSYNEIENQTLAEVSNSLINQGAQDWGNVTLDAKDDSDIRAITAAVAYGGKVGFGASVAISEIANTTRARASNTDIRAANLSVLALNDAFILSIAAAGGFSAGTAGIGGAVSVNEIENTTEASLTSDTGTANATMIVDGTVLLSAVDADAQSRDDVLSDLGHNDLNTSEAPLADSSKLKILSVAAGIAGAGRTAVGAAGSYNNIASDVRARISGVDVRVGTGDIVLDSRATAATLAIGAGLAGSGNASVAGSVAINTTGKGEADPNLTESVVEDGSQLTATAGDIALYARNDSTIQVITGAAAGAGSGAVSASGSYNEIRDATRVKVDDAVLDAARSVRLIATSDAVIKAIAAGGSGAGSVAFAGSIALNFMRNLTEALVSGDAQISADESVTVEADADNAVKVIAGSISVGGSVGVGGAVAVNDLDNTTRSAVSGAGTTIEAKGNGGAVQVDSGLLSAANADLADRQTKRGLRGVAVVASATDQIDSVVANLSGGGNAGVAASVGVNLVGGKTEAMVTDAQLLGGENAAAEQEVLVSAQHHAKVLGAAGGGAFGGGAGVGGATDTTIVTHLTRAMTDGAKLTAVKALDMESISSTDVESIAVGAGLSGTTGLSASVSVVRIAGSTEADANDSHLSSEGQLTIAASDLSASEIISGSAAIGGAAGIGVGVAVQSFEHDTKASTSGASVVDAGQATVILADAGRVMNNYAATVSAAGSVGVAGTAAVTVVKGETSAVVGGASKINQNKGGASQDVLVAANDSVVIDDKVGGLAVGIGAAGVGAGVDVILASNTTTAQLAAGAEVSAGRDIVVSATTRRNVDSIVIAAAGGATAGIGGAVSVINVGARADDEARSEVDKDGAGSVSEVDSMAGGSAVGNQLDSGESTAAQTAGNADTGRTAVSVKDDFDSNPAPSDRTAKALVATGSTLTAGNDISVTAQNSVDVDVIDVGVGASLGLSLGGGVGVVTVDDEVSATLGGTVTAGGDVLVQADDRDINTSTMASYAGGIGAVGLGAAVAILNKSSSADAELADGTVVHSAHDITIKGDIDHDVSVDAFQASGGLAGVGASVTRATTDGSVSATVGDNVVIGGFDGQSVNGLAVSAFAATDTSAETLAVAGGIISGAGADARATTAPMVVASIGENTTVVVDDDVRVKAGASTQVLTDASGFSGGAVDVGVSISSATANPTVLAHIGKGSAITAGDNIQLLAYHNWTPGNLPGDLGVALFGYKVRATAEASGGALLTVKGSEANATASVDTQTNIGDDAVLIADGQVSAQALSSGNVSAYADSYLGGLLAGGTADANATLTHRVQTLSGNRVEVLSAGDVTFSAVGDSVARAQTAGGVGGLLAVGGTSADVVVRHTAKVALGEGNIVESDDTVRLDARSSIDASSETDITSGGAITFNQTKSTTSVTADTSVDIARDTMITAKEIVVNAEVTKLRAKADAYSKTIAVDSTSEATANVDVDSDVAVNIATGTTLTGADRIAISAIHATPDVDAIATAQIKAGLTGTVRAFATANLAADADVDIADGSIFYTDDLYVAALAPEAKGMWNPVANAQANTVVKWVLTTVDVLVKEISKIPIIGWFVKWVWKKVSKWVAEILNSEVTQVAGGDLNIDNSVHFGADVYQLSSSSPVLRVDADGNIVESFLVDASRQGDEIVVNDLINAGRGKVVVDASNGLLFGDGRIFINNAYETVTLENNSNLDFRINDIDIASDHLTTPDIEFFSENDFDLEIVAGVERSRVDINNNSASNLIIAGLIENPFGDTFVNNQHGNIVATSDGVFQSSALSLTANNGSIGDAGQRLGVQMAAGETIPTLALLANDDVYLDITLVDFLAGNDVVEPRRADIDNALVGGDIDFVLNNGKAFVLEDAEKAPVEKPFSATYRINNQFAAGGDIGLSGAENAFIQLLGTMSSGFADITADINAQGMIAADEVDYMEGPATSVVTVESIQQKGGHISIDGNLGGTGVLQVLDGYSHVSIDNASPFDLVVNQVNLEPAVTPGIMLNGVAVDPSAGSASGLGVTTVGYESGDVAITSIGGGDVVLGGTLNSPSGMVVIQNTQGGITSRGSQQLIASGASLNAGNHSVEVSSLELSDQLAVVARTIDLPKVEHTGQTLKATVTGGQGMRAESVALALTSAGSVVFDSFLADNGSVRSSVDKVEFENADIGEVVTVDTPLHRIVIDNVNRTLYPNATGQLHSPNQPFRLQLLAERKFLTNAKLINFDPDYIANTFSTENSLTLLNVKRDTLPEITSDALEVSGSIVEAIVLAGLVSDNLATAAVGLVNYDEDDDEELLGLRGGDSVQSSEDLVIGN